MVLEIRYAKESDSENLWKWRNDPITREFSRNSDEIPWESHVKWYGKALENPSKKIFVGVSEGVGIGRIMFDRLEGNIAETGIVIAPEGRGKGHGSELIRSSSERYFSIENGVDEILAEILKINPASIRAFEKAGYVKREGYQRYGDERDNKYYFYFLTR